jgi:hypothetical protein
MSELTLKQANTIIDKALERARAMKIKPLVHGIQQAGLTVDAAGIGRESRADPPQDPFESRSRARFRAPANPSG